MSSRLPNNSSTRSLNRSEAGDPRKILRRVFTEVLNEQMFIFAEETDEGMLEPPAEPMLSVEIVYTGDAQGSVKMILPEALCREISANAVGVEEDELTAETDITDAAKELLNITCGQFLTAFYGEKPMMTLQVPQVGKLSVEALKVIIADFSGLAFIVDDHLILLQAQVSGSFFAMQSL
jgi:hypothetical protein